MQQFTVPQFIDVESKIIGPLTTRQFIILLVAAIISGIAYKIFDFSLFVTFSVIVLGIAAVLLLLELAAVRFIFFF